MVSNGLTQPKNRLYQVDLHFFGTKRDQVTRIRDDLSPYGSFYFVIVVSITKAILPSFSCEATEEKTTNIGALKR